MGLSLGVKSGDCVLVGDHVVEIKGTVQDCITVKFGGNFMRSPDREFTVLEPELRMRRGLVSGSQNTYPKLDIEAPKQIPISFIGEIEA